MNTCARVGRGGGHNKTVVSFLNVWTSLHHCFGFCASLALLKDVSDDIVEQCSGAVRSSLRWDSIVRAKEGGEVLKVLSLPLP